MAKKIEKQGWYKNYKFEVVLYELGHRCGYVYYPEGVQIFEEDIEVHGGITYHDTDERCIGFDCAHIYDAPDVQATREAFGDEAAEFAAKHSWGGTVRSVKFVEDECKKLIDQLPEQAG